MSTSWVAQHLLSMADGRTAMPMEQPRYNPRPPGVIRDGSATAAVLEFLSQHPRRYFTHCEILSATQRTPKSVDWALIFLRSQGLIVHTADEARNSRYKRYRFNK